MPAEIFGPDYPFLSRKELLSFDQILEITKAAEKMGVEKVRLTGGEPLLRRNIDQLIARIHDETQIEDIALTTNGLLLARQAAQLKASGLKRVNLSLDALDENVFAGMSGGFGSPEQVLEALDASLEAGLRVKVNSVIRRGVNDNQIQSLIRLGIEKAVEVRFIEYMDVGASNGWERQQVFSEAEILNRVEAEFGKTISQPVEAMAVARNYVLPEQGHYEWGVIASITRPFCGGCVRSRISADGKLYTCLFSDHGFDLRPYFSKSSDSDNLLNQMRRIWLGRKDRYSEERETSQPSTERVEMSFIGG